MKPVMISMIPVGYKVTVPAMTRTSAVGVYLDHVQVTIVDQSRTDETIVEYDGNQYHVSKTVMISEGE